MGDLPPELTAPGAITVLSFRIRIFIILEDESFFSSSFNRNNWLSIDQANRDKIMRSYSCLETIARPKLKFTAQKEP